jgi:hypothetical protein
MPMKCAIATVAIGEAYQSSHAAIFKPSVQRYVDRHNYDLFVFTDYIGDRQHRDPRCATFMKMLVPYHEAVRSHDILMVLDVDILISAKAPVFHTLDVGSKIGVVDEWCQPTREERVKFQVTNGLETSASEYYRLAGFALESEILINSGMFVCAPRVHGAFFRDIVARHTETQRSHPRGIHFEQAMFGYELQTNDLAHLLPIAWNRLWPQYRRAAKLRTSAVTDVRERWSDLKRFREVFDGSFLLHMTGGLDHDLAFISRNR